MKVDFNVSYYVDFFINMTTEFYLKFLSVQSLFRELSVNNVVCSTVEKTCVQKTQNFVIRNIHRLMSEALLLNDRVGSLIQGL